MEKRGKSLDDTGTVEKKEKAKRDFVEMVAWNVLGKPDNHDELRLLRKSFEKMYQR